MITQQRLREIYEYNPETGQFIYKTQSRMGPKVVGKIAGSERNGYIRLRVDGKNYSAHRLAWLYVYGEHPEGEIDHINRVRSDNRICNLRVVNRSANKLNCGGYANNTSGVKGVSIDRRRGTWRAQYRSVMIGTFYSKEEAMIARFRAENQGAI
jgi:hypothetical protein